MVLTRQTYREIFDHLLENVALYEAGDPELLALAAQNITRFDQFILIPVDDISAWTYEITNDAGNVVTKIYFYAKSHRSNIYSIGLGL